MKRFIIMWTMLLSLNINFSSAQCYEDNEQLRTISPTVNVWDWRGDILYQFYIRDEDDL